MKFPSAEWIDQVAAEASADADEIAKLGFCNLRLALAVNASPEGDSNLGLVLDGYEIRSEGAVDPDTWQPDCTLEGPIGAWVDMLSNIAANGRADLGHTLNALTLAEFPMRVTAADPMGRDLFFRYNETLQEVFDRTARVDTEFPAGVA